MCDLVILVFVLASHESSHFAKYWILSFRISSILGVFNFCIKPCKVLSGVHNRTNATLSLLCFVVAEVLVAYHTVLSSFVNVQWWYRFFVCGCLCIYIYNGARTVVHMLSFPKMSQTYPDMGMKGVGGVWSGSVWLLRNGSQLNLVYAEYRAITMMVASTLTMGAFFVPALFYDAILWHERGILSLFTICLTHVLLMAGTVNRTVFVATKAQLIQSNLDAKCRVISYVSHEVRNPLNIMLMGLTVLKKDLREILLPIPDSQNILELIRDIHHSCDVAVKIMDDLVDFENEDSLPAPRVDINAYKWLDTCVDGFRLQARSKNVVVRTDFEPLTGQLQPVVKIEAGNIDRAIASIFANAIKFSEVNGIVSLCSSVEGLESASPSPAPSPRRSMSPMSIASHDENSLFCKIEIADSGCGLSDMCVGMLNTVLNDGTNTEQISKEFYDELALTDVLSPGVGLVGARNVIHRHGGTISLASPGLGYGTVVSIRIPCDCYSEDSPVESSDASNSKAQNTEKGPLSKFTFDDCTVEDKGEDKGEQVDAPEVSGALLIVDDSPLVRKMMIKMMTSRGYTCFEADDGDECLKLMGIDYNPATGATNIMNEEKHKLFDVILLDNCMPKLSGWKTVAALRKHHYELPVIGITGNVLTSDLEEFANCGADVVLKKPISGDTVAKAIVSLQALKSKKHN